MLTLPAPGTYTIVVDPSDKATGSLTLGLASVPADLMQTISVGGTSSVATSTAGQDAIVAFTGVANQRVALDVSGSTYDYAYVTLKKPDGGTLWSTSFSAGRNAWSDVLTLPAPGTYTIVVDPSDKATGS